MNAKDEFIDVVKDLKIVCAKITLGDEDCGSVKKKIILKKDYSLKDYNIFLNELDFNYDSGYILQILFGVIICENNIWMSRGEYGGSEWWDIHKLPEIPEECKNNK